MLLSPTLILSKSQGPGGTVGAQVPDRVHTYQTPWFGGTKGGRYDRGSGEVHQVCTRVRKRLHEEDEEDSCKANPYGPQGRPRRLARVYEGVGTWFCAAVHDVKP